MIEEAVTVGEEMREEGRMRRSEAGGRRMEEAKETMGQPAKYVDSVLHTSRAQHFYWRGREEDAERGMEGGREWVKRGRL